MTKIQIRLLFSLIFLCCAALLATVMFIEPFKSIEPCPMCMMQRVAFVAVGIVALLAALHNPDYLGQKAYALFLTIFAASGASVAIRQVWLQSLPEDQVPACGPGIEYMLEVFPILEALQMAIRGTGDCAKVHWQMFGIAIPGWSLIAFAGFIFISLAILFMKRRGKA